MPRKIRPIRVEGNIAYITLTKGHEAIIDAEDVHMVDSGNWYAMIAGNTVYACRRVHSGMHSRVVLLHRVLMEPPDGLVVDHIDGNGLNNRRRASNCNIRIATRSQNLMNSGIYKHNSSGFRGVSWDKAKQKWRANIMMDGRSMHLGYFLTPEDASATYERVSKELYGHFRRIA